jgi:hypothetical protein
MKRTFLAAAIGQILIDRQMKNAEGEAEMTRMFMMTAEQHAQQLEAMTDGRDWAEDALKDYNDKYADHPACEGGRKIIAEGLERVTAALAMLKAMQPQEPVAWEHHFDDNSKRLSYCNDVAGFPPRADAIEVKQLYTPTKD